jgi:hypothetical protein
MTSEPPPAISRQRVRIFVDFWNFTIALGNWRSGFQLDWKKFGPWVAKKAGDVAQIADPVSFGGLHVYMSYDPNKPDGDAKLKNWAVSTLDHFPGVQVKLLERKVKSAPKCPYCQTRVDRCASCGRSMKGTVEKGVDTALVTDMIRLAWEDAYDLAVLISSDRDFIPAVEFLNQKGRRVINAYFPPRGAELAAKCWGNVHLVPAIAEIERP